MQRPETLGLRHIALFAIHFDACVKFYKDILGMKIVWQPDADNFYFSSGTDNLALHRAPKNLTADKNQRLDHFGFFLKTREDVDAWHDYLQHEHVKIVAAPKDHRDNTRSLYCQDPDGNVIQFIYCP